MTDFTSRVTGWLFVAAAATLWLGWVLLPARMGAFFRPRDFAAIRASYRRWIWLFRLHIFGYVTTVMAAAALAVAVERGDARVLVWPGLAVLTAGSLVGALGAAFYYHMGAWGALDLDGRGAGGACRGAPARRHPAALAGLGRSRARCGRDRGDDGGARPAGAVSAHLPFERRVDAGGGRRHAAGGTGCEWLRPLSAALSRVTLSEAKGA